MLPEKLNILGIQFDVKQEKSKEDGPSAYVNVFAQEIWINTRIGKLDGIYMDLVHEIIEVLNVLLDLNLNHQTITSLAQGLFQVLSTNKLAFHEVKTKGK